jgi:hypothetical protein
MTSRSTLAPTHRSHGASLAEALAVICLALPFVLLLLDSSVLLIGLTMNDAACREACRAASMGAPAAIRKGEPEKNAQAAIQSFMAKSFLIKLSPKLKISEDLRLPLPAPPFGGPVHGEVSVITSAYITLPFTCNVLHRSPITLVANRTFAYTWTLPSDVTTVKQ